MRYAKGGLVISAERDIPLLLQVRNSRFVSHAQLFEFMKFGGVDRSRNSFNWRVKRLVMYGQLDFCQEVYGAGSASTASDGAGLRCSNTTANSRQCCIPIPYISPMFHRRSIRLN